jgi:ribosome-binding protein aMBF1 (putative translation factor)
MEWIIIGIILLLIIAAFSGHGKCDICGLPIKKKYYKWEIEGKTQKLCPKCNSQMERKVSKEAFKKKFSD